MVHFEKGVNTMRFVYNERKAAQVAAQFTKMIGGKIYYIHLIKLMYLADRLYLLEKGRPITGDEFFAMKNGPILSKTLNLINDEPLTKDTPWFEYITPPADFCVSLAKQNPQVDELSKSELETIRQVFERYGHIDRFALVALTHTGLCPEWKDPGDSNMRIRPEDILREEGKTDFEIQSVRDNSSVVGTLEFIKSLPIGREGIQHAT